MSLKMNSQSKPNVDQFMETELRDLCAYPRMSHIWQSVLFLKSKGSPCGFVRAGSIPHKLIWPQFSILFFYYHTAAWHDHESTPRLPRVMLHNREDLTQRLHPLTKNTISFFLKGTNFLLEKISRYRNVNCAEKKITNRATENESYRDDKICFTRHYFTQASEDASRTV